MFSNLFINGTVAVVSLVMMTMKDEEEVDNIEICSCKRIEVLHKLGVENPRQSSAKY